MTPAEIEQGRRLVEAATPGEWFCPDPEDNPSAIKSDQDTRWVYLADFMEENDRQLMVWGRNNLPALLDAYEAAVAENARLRKGLEDAFRDLGHIEQEAQGVRVKIVRLAHAGHERIRRTLSGGEA